MSNSSNIITHTEIELLRTILKDMIYRKANSKVENLIENYTFDWERFRKVLKYHEIAPVAYLSLKKYFPLLPKDIVNFLKENYHNCLFKALNFEQEFFSFIISLTEEKIPFVPIKGLAVLMDLYDKHFVRLMNDIDILVKEKDLLKVEKIFKKLRYARELSGRKLSYWRNKQCHISYFKNFPEDLPFFIDVHWSLDFKRNNSDILPFLWKRTREIVVEGKKIRLLSPEDTLFSFALHKRRFGKILSLKDICDIGLLLRKYNTEFNWDYVIKECKNGKMCSTVFFMLSWVKFTLGPDLIPSNIWKNLDISYWRGKFVKGFFRKNAFRKNPDLGEEYKYLIAHFLLYDTFLEPIKYILKIPQEQFAKFYRLKPYSNNTVLFYRMRILYILFQIINNYFKILKEKWSLH